MKKLASHGGDFRGARICGEGRNTSSPKIACVGGYEEMSSGSEVSNFKCKLVGKRNSGHTYWTKPDLPRGPAQMVRFDEEIMKLFSRQSPREEKVSLLGWS